MSRIRANQITNQSADGAPTVQNGLVISGVCTATSFSGIDTDKISEGNTEVETIDTGSDGHIKFTTEGNEKLRIQSDEYIWVNKGNANNNAQFVLDKSASGGAGVRFYNAGSQLAYIQLDASEDMNYYGGSGVDQIFYAGLYERLRITSGGKVGIGSVTPGATLDLQSGDTEVLLRLNTRPVKNGYLDIVSDANRRGVIRFKDSLTDGGNYRWSIGNGDSDELSNTSFHISSGNSGGGDAKLVIDSIGRVLIGTTTEGHAAADDLTIATSGSTGITI